MKQTAKHDDALLFMALKSDTPDQSRCKNRMINRRQLVASLHLHGGYNTTRDIAEYFLMKHGMTVSHVTIAADLKALREEWQAIALKTTTEHFSAELVKLANLEKTAIEALEDNTISRKDYITEMTRLMKRRSAMLGLDKAQKLVIEDKRESELDDAELEAIIKTAKKERK